MINLGALSLALNTVGQKSINGLIQDPELTGEKSRMVTCDPHT